MLWVIPGGSALKNLLTIQDTTCNEGERSGFKLWVRKILWRRKLQPTPAFLPGKITWTEKSGGLQSMGLQRVRHNLATEHTHTHIHTEKFTTVINQYKRKNW